MSPILITNHLLLIMAQSNNSSASLQALYNLSIQHQRQAVTLLIINSTIQDSPSEVSLRWQVLCFVCTRCKTEQTNKVVLNSLLLVNAR